MQEKGTLWPHDLERKLGPAASFPSKICVPGTLPQPLPGFKKREVGGWLQVKLFITSNNGSNALLEQTT